MRLRQISTDATKFSKNFVCRRSGTVVTEVDPAHGVGLLCEPLCPLCSSSRKVLPCAPLCPLCLLLHGVPRSVNLCRAVTLLLIYMLHRTKISFLGAIPMKLKNVTWAALIVSTLLFAKMNAVQNTFTPDQIKWGPPPPFVAAGAQLAVLEGDPSATSGEYTIRLKMPDGYKVAPHWHPKRENVTVISGNFKVGMGDTFDASKMTTFGPGSFAY